MQSLLVETSRALLTVGDVTLADRQNALADQRKLGQVARPEQHTATPLGEIADEFVDL